MHIIKIDPRALKDNPDDARRSKSNPQSDALLLATIKAVGIIQPPIVSQDAGGGNGFVIQAGHRRTRQAIAAELEEIEVIVTDAADDGGAMRSMVENIAREPLNPVDQWRAIERLVALGWTEDGIATALALSVRQIKKLRLLANVLPVMLDQMAKGDMPDERQLRTIAAASLDDQKEVWKAHKPTKADPHASWWSIAQGLTKTRMYARDASFGDDLAAAYGISWVEDLFAPADEDSRYTTDVEAYLGAQQEWMSNNLPKKGVIAKANNWGEPDLPKKAERVYGKPRKSDHTALYLDRHGKVQSVHFRMPAQREDKAKSDEAVVAPATRPDVTRKGVEMIGDFRTDALHDALGRAPVEDDMLTALLILAFAAENVKVESANGSNGVYYSGNRRIGQHAASLFDVEGKLSFDKDTLRIAARSMLIEVLSCQENRTRSGIVATVAGEIIGADEFLPNMGTDEFLSCLSRQALEASCEGTPAQPQARVKDTRAALVAHFTEQPFVHPVALFVPDRETLGTWLTANSVVEEDDEAEAEDQAAEEEEAVSGDANGEDSEAFREAAE